MDKELKIEKKLAVTPFICNFAAQNVITNKIIDNNKLNPILNKIILSKNNILDIERNNSILENFYK